MMAVPTLAERQWSLHRRSEELPDLKFNGQRTAAELGESLQHDLIVLADTYLPLAGGAQYFVNLVGFPALIIKLAAKAPSLTSAEEVRDVESAVSKLVVVENRPTYHVLGSRTW